VGAEFFFTRSHRQTWRS